ncbi:hypothetical protein V8B55DRAFT_1447070 [Mucor lusitanicus]
MAFHYEQDEVLNWPQSGLDGINELNQFDEKHMYVFEEEIYLTHANPEEHMSNDWSIYKNTGLEDIVYPDYTGLMGEDCRGAINYNQLLAKYEAATSSGANPFYDFAGAVQDLCESVNQVDEAVLADHITQPNSPQPSFSSIIDYSIYAPDGELEDEQELDGFQGLTEQEYFGKSHDGSHGKGSEEQTVPRSASKSNRDWSYIEARGNIAQINAAHRINARSLGIRSTFQGNSHFQTRRHRSIFDYDNLCNTDSRSQGTIPKESKSKSF